MLSLDFSDQTKFRIIAMDTFEVNGEEIVIYKWQLGSKIAIRKKSQYELF